MDLGNAFKDNIKVFLPVLGLVAVLVVFYAIDLDSSSITSITPVTVERRERVNAQVNTSLGTFVVELYPKVAPKNVENFISLAEDGFYDSLTFHRIVPDFVIQTGDPTGEGYGNAGYYVEDEISDNLTFGEYVVAMANEGEPNTNSSQFFVTLGGGNFSHLDGSYTIIGGVVEGRDVVDSIGRAREGEVFVRNVVIEKDR